ncbi:MAG: DUF2799 domain-containing protein [Reinekea sp.]|nr:DUF2799 domain-containing protein [Reinekea sp.]
MSRLFTVAVVVCCLFVTGCSSLSKKDCVNADWYQMGVQDGQAGYAADRVSNYVAMCAKHDIRIDQNQYQTGHEQGIRRFCQPDNGYQQGLKGRSLPTVCPADMQSAFAEAYERGYQEYRLKRDISDAEQAIKRGERDVASLENDLINATATLYGAVGDEQKSSAQQSVDDLNGRIQNAELSTLAAQGKLACASGDWYAAGLTDGLAGRSGATYKRHVRQCDTYHPLPSQSEYIKGQSEGIQRYCTFATGEALGLRGRSPSNLCQGAGKRNIEAGYEQGLRDYNAKVTVAGLKMRRDTLEQSLPALEQEQARLENELQRTDLTSQQKLTLTRELNRARLDLTRQQVHLKETATELNCYIADWQAIGFEAGEQGAVYENDSLNCQAYGLRVDTEQFRIGYELGLVNYCTAANGQQVGAQGLEYANVCPRRTEADFLDGYLPAYRAYQRTELKRQLTVEVAQSEKVLANMQQEIDLLTNDLNQSGLTRAQRLTIINEIAALTKEEQALVADSQLQKAHLQCLTDDWLQLGKQHGAQGLSSQLRVLNCPRFEIAPDTSSYRNGLSRGLLSWCTVERGYDMALAGVAASEACSRTTHREYFRGYSDGESQRQKQDRIDQLRLEKLTLLEQQPLATARIEEIDLLLAGSGLSSSTIRRLKQERLTLQQTLLTNEARLEEIEKELAALGS